LVEELKTEIKAAMKEKG